MVDKYIENIQMPDGINLKIPVIPSGGAPNNILIKQSDTEYDVKWSNFFTTVIQKHHDITSGDITLSDISNSIYRITPTEDITFSFITDNLNTSETYTFELKITMDTLYSFTFPDTIKWVDDTLPDLSEVGIYYLVFRTDDGGITWFGNSQGKWSL